jgi:ADP-heptose:LPS heptosyltransferase
MGDVLYRTCSLPALRKGLPECEWSFLTSPIVADVLTGNPHVSEVLPWNVGENSWTLERGGMQRLREKDFDVVLCTNSLRYYPDVLLGASLGIPNRVGFTHKGLSGLVNYPVAIGFPGSYASYFRSMVAAVTGLDADWPLTPQVYSDAKVEERATAVWRQAGLDDGTPVIACCISTRQHAGNFPVERLLEVLVRAREIESFRIAFFGTTSDRPLLDARAKQFGADACVIAGELSIRELAEVFRKCSALLTLDSGPRHLGNAAGIPVFFARNMSHSRIEAGAYCVTETDIAPDGEYLNDDEIAAAARSFSPESAAGMLAGVIRGAARPA